VHSAVRAAGRDPGDFRIVCRGSFRLTPERLGPGRRALAGSLDEIRDDIARYAAAGVTELFLDPNFQPGGAELTSVLAQIETLAP
jgi:alkanesulfonate monooxygenase SsuD/methylene tetrahydromethanopterin reductase-like flavin-dependent oxidoreductase (luciferase family)